MSESAAARADDLAVGPLLDIVHEDEELLVVNKPANLVCHPTKKGALSSLIGRVRQHLGDTEPAHFVNRLDRETSGLVLLAKTRQAARELGRIWQTRRVEKEYVAVVHGHPRLEHGTIEAALGKDESSPVTVKNCVRADGAPSHTDYEVLRRFERPRPGEQPLPFTLLRVFPRTGRKHQIRIHLAHIGHPVVGDKLYGGWEDDYLALVEGRLGEEQRARLVLPFHALHARAVRFAWKGAVREFSCEPRDAEWESFHVPAGGTVHGDSNRRDDH